MRQTRRQISKVAPEECNQASICLGNYRQCFIFASLGVLIFGRALIKFLECIFPNLRLIVVFWSSAKVAVVLFNVVGTSLI
jgi:hypothetical protein